MTYKFTPPDWKGESVAVIASGKSLTQELADSVKHMKRIAVRRAFRVAPDADIVLALDAPPNFGFWEESQDFAGIRVCGVEVEGLDAYHAHIPHECVEIAPGHLIEVRNNGLAALRLAAMTGAAKVVLVGFDAPPYSHFYGDADPDWDRYPGLQQGIAKIVAELRGAGVEVVGEPEQAPPAAVAYTQPGEVEHIVSLVASVDPRVVIEIGCNAGRTAAAILAAVASIERYVGIDAEPGHVTTLASQQGEILEQPGHLAASDARFELLTRPRGSFDLTAADLPQAHAVFIDGDHSHAGVLNDYSLAVAATQSGGIIIFHDDGREDMGVATALREIEAGGVKVDRIDGTSIAYVRVPAKPLRKGRA